MSRQCSPTASRPAHGPHPQRTARTGGGRRLLGAGAATALATGLLLGWTAPFSLARQAPDSWSAQRGAQLPSGLTVQLDFAAQPGITAAADPGRLADRAGGATAVFADGRRAGDPAETFRFTEDRPRTDGSWRTLGTLRITFSRAVRDPRLHVSGLAGLAVGAGGSTATATRLTVTGGSPAAPALVARTGWAGWTVAGDTLAPAGADGAADGSSDAVAEGSLELAGTFTTATLRVERRSTARAGGTTAPGPLEQAFTVTLDEQVGSAPSGYANASHLVTDLLLGADAGRGGPPPDARRQAAGAVAGGGAGPVGRRPAEPAPADAPTVERDGGASRRSVFSSRTPPEPQPGRTDYQGADPTVDYPAEGAVGRYYRLTVPVATGSGPATLAGWVDFDHNGRFDATERVQSVIPAGSTSTALEWTVPANAVGGETWARLRLGRDASQLVAPGGFADSGGVEDQRIRLAVGAARPEIAAPVAGTAVADARPQISGGGVVAGAKVEVREGDGVLCRAGADRTGDWRCRPDVALADGAHDLTPVETTPGGLVLTGDPVRVTVRTAPPATPLISLPEFTNDPGLLLTGTAGPGGTVSVTDRPDGAGAAAELCSTAVRPDGAWSCLPVENLVDGTHRLTPAAVDAAGNRATGRVTPLVVDTAAPARPVLTAPTAGATVAAIRPRFEGRAEPGATVRVTAGAGAGTTGERAVSCSAVAAVDGHWSCTAMRDLAPGDRSLVVTATDRAGNGTSADAVTIRVAAASSAPIPAPAAPKPSPSPSASAVSSPRPSSSSPVAARPSASAVSGTSPSPSPVPSRQPSARPAVSGSASAAAPVAVSLAPAPAASPGAGAAPGPVAPGLLPVFVPPVTGAVPPPVSPPVANGGAAATVPSSSTARTPNSGRTATPSPSTARTAAPNPGSARGPSTPVPAATVATPTSTSVPMTVPAATPSSPVAPVTSPAVSRPASPAASSALLPGVPSLSPAPPSSSAGVAVTSTEPSAESSAEASPAASAAASPAGSTPISPPASFGAVPADRAAGGDPGVAAARAADTVGSASDDVVRAPAAPPAEASRSTAGSASGGWRAVLGGGLLLLVAGGLITRRVFGRGPGRRRWPGYED